MSLEKETARVYAALERRRVVDGRTQRYVSSVVPSEEERDKEADPHDEALNEELIALLEYFTANERQQTGLEERIARWLEGLEHALEDTIQNHARSSERAQLLPRRGIYRGIADDIRNGNWKPLSER